MAASEPTLPAPDPSALFKKRSTNKFTIRKRAATPPSADESSSSDELTDDDGHRVKRRRRANGVVVTAPRKTKDGKIPDEDDTRFAADRSTAIQTANDATKHSNWFDDGESAPESKQNGNAASTAEPASGVYRGADGYQSFIQKNPNAAARQKGPVRAPANVRTITVTDYAPDVCKDYKQTGFCGFGDSCKFLHAREDYKQGWQLDRDWETVTKDRKVGLSAAGPGRTSASRAPEGAPEADDDEAEATLLEGIPFACIICKDAYKNPVVTKCGHYFCEACSLKRYKRTPNCAACGAGTGGVFNGARNLKRLLEKKQERAERQKGPEDKDYQDQDE